MNIAPLLTCVEATRKICHAIAFSPDGKLLAYVQYNSVGVWDLDKKVQVAVVGGQSPDSVYGIVFSPDGKLLITAGWDRCVRCWDTANWKLAKSLDFPGEDGVISLALSPDGRMLAAGNAASTGIVFLWNADNLHEKLRLVTHNGFVNSISFAPDSQLIATASLDGTAKIWRVADGSLIGTYEGHKLDVKCVRFSPDGTEIATGSDDETVKLWNVGTTEVKATLLGHKDGVLCLAFSLDGNYLFVGYGYGLVNTGPPDPGLLTIWNLKTDEQTAAYLLHGSTIHCMALSPDGKTLATGSQDGAVNLWDVNRLLRK